MLNNDILKAVSNYTKDMNNDVTLVLQTGEHQKRPELVNFLSQIAATSSNLHFTEHNDPSKLTSPLTFGLQVDGQYNGIFFSGIPGGHEFNSFILAVLQSSGTALKLDSHIQNMVKAIEQPLNFEVFISLSCENCPDVVQSLNQFVLLNDNIQSEMIDGGLFPEQIAARNIQGVPSVYLNGEVFANGKITTAQLIEKLQQKFPRMNEAVETESLPEQDVTVIGGGPAGVAAAIYAARKGLKVTMIADRIGGQVKDTMGIENLISVSSTTGPQLTGNLQNHMDDYDITLKEHVRVNKVDKISSKNDSQNNIAKTLHLSSGEQIDSKTIIVATGAKWRELGVPGEKENIGNGVAYCPHCDGPFFKGKDVAVIGGGNSGIEAALDLAGIVNHVTVFEFLPELKADAVLVKQAMNKDNITIIKNVATKQILAADGKVNAIEYQDRATEQVHQLSLNGIFVQIGLVPNSEFIRGTIETSKFGEIIIDAKGQTTEPGIFACGDVTTVPYKQIVIAMGEGAKASLSAFDYLIRQG